jgi:hypothetical protein
MYLRSQPPQQQQQLFRVRNSSQRIGSKADGDQDPKSPVGLNDSAGFPGARDFLPGDMEGAHSGGQVSRRDGAKPFLEQLFEDVRLAHADDEVPATALDNRTPGASYGEQVRRQWAKPNILQSCVSTDAVPLPTTTGPVNYTCFDLSRYERPDDPPMFGGVGRHRGRVFAGIHAAVDMRRTRDALVMLPDGSLKTGGAPPTATSGGFSFYNEAEELESIHLRFLMSTIQQAKKRSGIL